MLMVGYLEQKQTENSLYQSWCQEHNRDGADRDTPVGFVFEMGMLLLSSQHPTWLLSGFCAALFICESM